MIDSEDIKPIQQIKIFMNMQNLKIAEFERIIGVSQNTIQTAIKRDSQLKDVTLARIFQAFPRLNYKWVFFNEGDMLVSPMDATIEKEMEEEPNFNQALETINMIKDEAVATILREQVFRLYQSNSALKTELLRIYRLAGHL